MKNNQSNQTDQLKHRTNKLPANSSTNRQKTRTYNPTTNLKTTNKNIHQMKNLLAMLLIVFGLTVQAQKPVPSDPKATPEAVSYTHLRAHETRHDLVCRLLLEK